MTSPTPTGGTRLPSRAAILTVDDDPAVSRAVARDLRRHYGEKYRIVPAESGATALEALKEMKLRGDEVAVLLADHRMPQMSGIEFLEQAMDLFPLARRVLLTAYADTDAAIEAINDLDLDLDLDHYLLTPWDPAGGEVLSRHRRAAHCVAGDRSQAGDGHQGRRSQTSASAPGAR